MKDKIRVILDLIFLTTNTEALFEVHARRTKKKKEVRREKLQLHAKCKHCKYEIGCFGGSGFAARHHEEYRLLLYF